MSIFDNVWDFHPSEELKTVIVLKYGNIPDVNLLPDIVIQRFYESVQDYYFNAAWSNDLRVQREFLKILLESDIRLEKFKQVINLHLLQYHTLNP